MSILSTFSKKAPNRVFLSIVIGALAGVFYSTLIPLVLSSVSSNTPGLLADEANVKTIFSIEVVNYRLAAVYLVACVAILLMRSLSEIMLVRVSSEVARDLRERFYRQISSAPLSAIENIGSAKLIASINIDVPRIVAGGRALPSLLVNSITLVGMLGFLLYLNMDVFKLVMFAILVGVVCYQFPMMVGARIFKRSRDIQDELQASIRGLIYGAKELKLDCHKKNFFFRNALFEREEQLMRNDKRAHTIVRATTSFGDLLSFFVIGAVCFVFVNYHAVSKEEILGVIMALLYVTGPIAVMMSAIPTLTISSISYRKLNKLIENIESESCSLQQVILSPWQTVRFEQVEYRYPFVGDEPGFHVGPLNFEVCKGEITFIVGGNGSGKSTLSKLLTLHYLPAAGHIYFGEQIVESSTVTSHRLCIGAIYSDYYLFDELLLDLTDELTDQANSYLEKLGLAHKVKINNGRFTTLSLSDGQRKRLALLVAFLEDKEFYLFDEWAADQDPEFKRVFYTDILVELKMKGKVVVIISHDDSYFYCADRILQMSNGSVMQVAVEENDIKSLAPIVKQVNFSECVD